MFILHGALYADTAEPVAAPSAQPTAQPAEAAVPAATDNDTVRRWKLEVLAAASATYDDNIFIQRTDKKKDFYFNIDPTFAFGIGNFRDAVAVFANIPHFLVRTGEEELPWKNYAFISYTPDGIIFSKYHREDQLNHDARFAAQEERDLWTVKSDLHFQTVSAPVIDVGNRINETDYIGDLSAAYSLTGRLSLGSEIYGDHSDYSQGFSSTDGRGSLFLSDQIASKTSIGVEGTGGYLRVSQGANQPYEQALFTLGYQPTGKLFFSGKAGYEYRQFQSRVPNRSLFVFQANGTYDPTDSTELSLGVNRDTLASALYSDEDIIESVYQASIRQRFVQRIYAMLTGGYAHNKYENNEPVAVVARHDDYYFYLVSLSCDVTRHGTVQLSYEHRDNQSTLTAFKFTENLYGVQVSFLF